MHITLNPIEKAVLASCEEWRSLSELQDDLSLEFRADRIESALAYLRRRDLVRELYDGESRLSAPAAYTQTFAGVLVLLDQRRVEDQELIHA